MGGRLTGVPDLIVIVGPIASGKTTVARALGDHFRKAGRRVAVLDLDDVVETIGGFLGLAEALFQQAQVVHGQLVGAWLDQGFDVIAHGPFFEALENDALLHAVPDAIVPRRVLLNASYEVALGRVRAEPDRVLSHYPEVLKATYDRVEKLLPTLPPSDWTFDTAGTSSDAIVHELAQALLQ